MLSNEVERLAEAVERLRCREAHLGAEAQILQKKLKANRRREDVLREKVFNIALALFVWECPDDDLAASYLADKGAELWTEDIHGLRDMLAKAYLELGVEEINDIYDRRSRRLSQRGYLEADRYRLDRELLTWVGEQNMRQGIAPSYRMLATRRDSYRSADNMDHLSWNTSYVGAQKWVQRFRVRWRLDLSVIPPRSLHSVEDLQAKVFAFVCSP